MDVTKNSMKASDKVVIFFSFLRIVYVVNVSI